MIAVSGAFTQMRKGKDPAKHQTLESLDRNINTPVVDKSGGMEKMDYLLKISTGIMIMDKVYRTYMIGEEAKMGHLIAVLDVYLTHQLINNFEVLHEKQLS